MSPVDVVDIAREAIWVLIKIAGPGMIVALIVGLCISLLQALTQIQEMTLAFVPKIVCMFIALIVFMPFMISSLVGFTQEIANRISALQ